MPRSERADCRGESPVGARRSGDARAAGAHPCAHPWQATSHLGRGGRQEGMLAAQLRAGGVGDASALGQAEERFAFPGRRGEQSLGKGVPGRAGVWCCPARARDCPAKTCFASLFPAKSLVIPAAVVD